jgi:hypothetical protein
MHLSLEKALTFSEQFYRISLVKEDSDVKLSSNSLNAIRQV